MQVMAFPIVQSGLLAIDLGHLYFPDIDSTLKSMHM